MKSRKYSHVQLQTVHDHLREAKRELEAKDAHVDLLRKKLVSLETDQSLKVWQISSDINVNDIRLNPIGRS